MSHTITYTCDRCNKVTQKAHLFQVGFVMNNVMRQPIPQSSNTCDWCRDCVSAMNLNSVPRPPTEPAPTTSEKLEEIIRSIVKEEIEDRQ